MLLFLLLFGLALGQDCNRDFADCDACERDECGVCFGDGSSCRDCAFQFKDNCGVCNGDGTSCVDCNGVVNGVSVYDACDICGGPNGATCFDCAGVPFGSSDYDVCDVCGGDSSSCRSCDGAVFGSNVYDLCDVCGGSNACIDCNGDVGGLASYDLCDVCDGDDTSCIDCRGTLNGDYVRNSCNQCIPREELFDSDGDRIPCIETTLISSLSARLELFVVLFLLLLVIIFILAILCTAQGGAGIVGFFWNAFPTVNAAPMRRVGPGGGAPPKTVVFAVAIISLLSGAEATPAQDFHREVCLSTNIDSIIGGCSPLGQSACVTWPDYVTCYPDLDGVIARVRFELLDPLGGRITPQLFQLMRTAISITFVGRTDEPTAMTTLPDLRQLTFPFFETVDFSTFTDLEILRIRSVHFHKSGLPASISTLIKLKELTITDSDLGGEIPDGICSLASLVELKLINVELEGKMICANVGALQQLVRFEVSKNMLSGEMGDFSLNQNIRFLIFDNNQIIGLLNAPFLPPKFRVLRARHNRISSVSETWLAAPIDGNGEVSISYNQITGKLPILSVSSLYIYDASHNQFSEWADSGLYACPWDRFDVSYNQLPGPIPGFGQDSDCFDVGDCHFENNLFCDESQVGLLFRNDECTYTITPEVCGCANPGCIDCLGTQDGTAVYDQCDICNGDGTLCLDCDGVPFGTSNYDQCDICNGDGDTCRDCAGSAGGNAQYDACDVCNGDSSSCSDCAGVPNGPYVIDACEECVFPLRANLTCVDCAGVFNGTSLFDEDGVCNGDGSSNPSPLEIDFAWSDNALLLLVALFIFSILTFCCLAFAIASCVRALRRG